MRKCLFLLLTLQMLIMKSAPRPIKPVRSNDAFYARSIFTKLLRDAVIHRTDNNHLERSHDIQDSGNYEYDEHNSQKDALPVIHSIDPKPEADNIVEMSLAVSLDWFAHHKIIFLDELQRLIGNKHVECHIGSVQSLSHTNIMAEFYCYYTEATITHEIISYVPSYKLKKLLNSAFVNKIFDKYNSTIVTREIADDESSTSLSIAFLRHQWLPLTLGGIAFVFVVIIIALLAYFCCSCHKDVKDGEKVEGKSFEESHVTKLQRKDLQLNLPMSHNTYDFSPKRKLFSYSPNKISTPIFSFTSPSKYKDSLIYPASPIETSVPRPVQPQMELLYPSVASTPTMRKLSGYSTGSGNSSLDKSRTLLQSRRGSSASLIIDVSPRTPSLDLSIPIHESPTEEILMRKSRPLRFQELRRAQANDKELHEEFWGIPPNTVSRKDTSMKHSLKNRYPDILPNSRSMVKLKTDDLKEKYINANFMKAYGGFPNQFIATQGPLTNTVEDFWQMVWQFDVPAVVMITKLKESNKEKCCRYWPSPETLRQQTYGNVTVTYDSELESDGYNITTLYLSCKGLEETKKVTHYWFTAWPDHKVPKSCDQVVSLAYEVRDAHALKQKPIIVHCSAGRGRTGCFIAISSGIAQIDEDNFVDILKIVSRMRIDRGGMVDKDHQYRFVYKALCEYWSKKQHRLDSPASPTFSRYSTEEAHEERDHSFDDEDDGDNDDDFDEQTNY